MNNVAMIIPAFNEESAIGKVVQSVPRAFVQRIIVADNGSTDWTAEVARAAGAEVVYEPKRGYGVACLAGLRHLNHEAEIIVFMDGDASDDPEDLPALLEPIQKGEADLVIGSRALGKADSGSLTIQQRVGNWIATKLLWLGWGVRWSDLGPFRAITQSALEQLKMQDQDFGWTIEMQIRAAEEGLRVREVSVSYHQRIGISKVSGTWKGSWNAGRVILGKIAAHWPLAFPIVVSGLIMETVYLVFHHLHWESFSVFSYLVLMGLLFLLFGYSMWKVNKIRNSPPILIWFILGMGIVFRLTLFPVGPLTSDDIYRYVWDGKMQAQGMNPYAYPPSHDALSRWKEVAIHPHINHSELPTIYPPAAQIFFRWAYEWGGDTLYGFKLLSLLAEVATCWLLIQWMRKMGRSPVLVIGYAWCPLPIVEFFANGHVDVLMIPWVVGAAWGMWEGRWFLAALGIAVAAMVKMVPLLLVPAILARLERGRRLTFVAVMTAAMAVICLPYAGELRNGLMTLMVYMNVWRFNGAAYNFLAQGVGLGEWSRPLCLYGLMISVLLIARRGGDWIRVTLWTLMAFALFSPIVFPWYLTWLVPFLALVPMWSGWALIVLSQLSYIILIECYRNGVWREHSGVLLWQYVPVMVLMMRDIWNGRLRGNHEN